MPSRAKVAILGSGNIGTDLMLKVSETSTTLEVAALVGIDPDSDGLARARARSIEAVSDGIDGLVSRAVWESIDIVFDATSAAAHSAHDRICRQAGKCLIDLTPAALGPYCIPVVNLQAHIEAPNVNMVTCGGQATIPIVHAIRRACDSVPYAEIIASISSRSAGPGTRANIDEFTQTTSRAIESVGGAVKGKAIIILNPAEPPLLMRDTVYAFAVGGNPREIETSILQMVQSVQAYVPGYRLKQAVQFEHFGPDRPLQIPGQPPLTGQKISVFLEVEGAGQYLPSYAGNLDIMTAAGMATAEKIATRRFGATA